MNNRKKRQADGHFGKRRLMLEELEPRRLLNGTPSFYGPPLPPIVEIGTGEPVAATGPFPAPEFLRCGEFGSLSERASLTTDSVVAALHRARLQEATESEASYESEGFEFYEVASDETEATSASEVDSSSGVAELIDVSTPSSLFGGSYSTQSGGSGGDGSGGETYWISLEVDASNVATYSGGYAMLERNGIYTGGSGILGSTHCLQITAPALPHWYSATISFSGTATPEVDYAVYTSYGSALTLGSSASVEYSGGATTLYVVPLNDAKPEGLETVVATLGTPYLVGSSGGWVPEDTTEFSYGSLSATATIFDDDQWQIEIVTSEDDSIALEPCSGDLTAEEKSVAITARRKETALAESWKALLPDYSLDAGYAATFELSFSGSADYGLDYELRSSPTGALASATTTIPANATETTLYVVALGDSEYEDDETVELTPSYAEWASYEKGYELSSAPAILTIYQAPEFIPYGTERATTVDYDYFSTVDYTSNDGDSVWNAIYQLCASSRSPDLRYRITGGNENGWFAIDETSGKITATSAYAEALRDDSTAVGVRTTLSVSVFDATSPYGSERFCDVATLTIGGFYYARVYDPYQESNRATRAVIYGNSVLDPVSSYEDNQRSDYDQEHTGIVWCGHDAEMTSGTITLEIGAEADVRSRILWSATTNHGCVIQSGATAGNFGGGVSVTLSVAPSADYRHETFDAGDLVLNVGYDANNDGILQQGEIKLTFNNTLFGKDEYDACCDLLNAASTASWWVNWSHNFDFTFSREFLKIFMRDEDYVGVNHSDATYSSSSYSLISYDVGSSELSQSNGKGVDNPTLTSGGVMRYAWNLNSEFVKKIYDSEDFTSAIVNEIFNSIDESSILDSLNSDASSDTCVVVLSPINTVINFSGHNDLHFALGHCSISLDSVSATFKKSSDNKLLLVSFFIEGIGSDLYDFKTTWGSVRLTDLADNGGVLTNLNNALNMAGFVVQSCHRNVFRIPGQVFRVELSLCHLFEKPEGFNRND